MARGSANSIARSIEDDIRTGALRAGDRLVAIRTMSDELGVSPATVQAAYRRLRERGLVVGRGRQGTRVAPSTVKTATGPQPVDGDDHVDARNGTPDETLLPDIAAAVIAAATQKQARYGDPLVTEELRAAARNHFSADGIDSTHLAVTSGSMDAVQRVLRAQGFRTGDRIGVEDPGHLPLHQVIRAAGLEVVPLPLDDDGLRPEGLRAALRHDLSGLIITPRCQNPTGAALTAQRASELSDILLDDPSVFVVHDDHAGDIAGIPYRSAAVHGDRWATIRATGKSFGPDLRVAIVAGDPTTIDRLNTSVANGPGWVSYLLQRATAHLMTDTASRAIVAEAADSYAHRRQLMISELARFGVSATGKSGLNVWIPTTDEQALVARARAAGYLIRAGDMWRINSAPAVRVTISHLTEDQIRELAASIGSTSSGEPMSQTV